MKSLYQIRRDSAAYWLRSFRWARTMYKNSSFREDLDFYSGQMNRYLFWYADLKGKIAEAKKS